MSKKILQLYDNLSIYKVELKELREQDKNARVMNPSKLKRLSENIKKDKRLESLPLLTNIKEDGKHHIISGHHRIRGWRMAGLEKEPIYALVIESEITSQQEKAKQLAHNSLQGEDNPVILKQIYDEIENMDLRLETGIESIKLEIENPTIKDISFDFDFEIVNLVFLSSQFTRFEEVINRLGFLTEKETDNKVYVASLNTFKDFSETVRKTGKRYNIRNLATVVDKMIEIVNAKLKESDK